MPNCGQSFTGCVPIEGPSTRRACLPDLSVSSSPVPRLQAHPPSARESWRHLEALAHVRRRHEPEHPLGARAASRQADRRVPRPRRPDSAVGSPDVRTGIGAGPRGRRARLPALVRPGLGVARRPRAHRAAHHRRGAMGPLAPGGRRAPGRRRRRDVPVPLDAGVRAGRPAAFAARHGLGGSECRKHGDDAPDRGVLRRVAVRAGRPHPGGRRLLDLPAPGRFPEQHPGRTQSGGPPTSASRPTPSTNRRLSRSSTAPSRWSPKGNGRSSGDSRPAFVTSRNFVALRPEERPCRSLGDPGKDVYRPGPHRHQPGPAGTSGSAGHLPGPAGSPLRRGVAKLE